MGIYNLPAALSYAKITRVVETTMMLQVSGTVSSPLDADSTRAWFTIYNPTTTDVYIDYSTAVNPTAPTLNACTFVLKPKSTYISDIPYYTGKIPLGCASGTPSVIVRAFYES